LFTVRQERFGEFLIRKSDSQLSFRSPILHTSTSTGERKKNARPTFFSTFIHRRRRRRRSCWLTGKPLWHLRYTGTHETDRRSRTNIKRIRKWFAFAMVNGLQM